MRMKNKETTKKPLIQVLGRSLDVLELLAKAEQPVQSIEIAAQLGIGLKTVNNILRSLFERGYVSQDDRRYYRLGGQCVWLGAVADRWAELRKVAYPYMEKLHHETSLEVFLGVIESDKLFCVAGIGNENQTNGITPQRWANKLHATATGRILLAMLTQEERKRLLARISRKKLTARTIISSQKLDDLCSDIQRRGYAEVDDESAMGIHSLAIPLRNVMGQPVAGLGISAPGELWNKLSLDKRLQLVRQTAAEITIKLI